MAFEIIKNIKKYRKLIAAVVMVIICLIILLVDWGKIFGKLVQQHQQILDQVNVTITDTMESLVATFSSPISEEEPQEEYLIFDDFSQLIESENQYSASGVKHIQESGNDRSYEFEMTLSDDEYAVKLIQGQNIVREVWTSETYYQIDEVHKVYSETDFTEEGRDLLSQICSGKVVTQKIEGKESSYQTVYEVYDQGTIYVVKFNSNGQLTQISSYMNNVYTTYSFDWLVFGEVESELLDVELEQYEQSTDSVVSSSGTNLFDGLTLPDEYPIESLPMPSLFDLQTVVVNLDEQGKGSISVTYSSAQSLDQLEAHYINWLQGSDGYMMAESLVNDQTQVTFTGSVEGWSVDYIILKYDAENDIVTVDILLSN